ncbi:MAG: DNA mismatch repair protein MutS [Clostridiales bacterium]|jgi:DNA mismatch repair protein MutS|nr:DNA mismatch repair protein MutS [Clostridiales bacterium]
MIYKLSPMMEYYMSVKKEHGDAILMLRLGDFYEMFFEDAIKASAILDLTLTARDCGLEKRAEMCGVPYHAVDNYIKKLIDHGLKVAVCDQLTTVEESKGKMLERGVMRVVTPGTVIDDVLLDAKSAVYIASVYLDKTGAGVAYADMAGGEFKCREIDNPYALEDFLLNVAPSEIIADEEAFKFICEMKSVNADRLVRPTKVLPYAYKYHNAEKKLLEQFNVASLEVYELIGKNRAVSAAGALMEYMTDTQKRKLSHFNKIIYVSDNAKMILDNNARRNLELIETIRDKRTIGTLLNLMDHTVTNMGARKLKRIIEDPLCDANGINARFDAVEELIENPRMKDTLKDRLRCVRDLERLAGRIAYGNFNPRDCSAIRETLDCLPEIKLSLTNAKSKLLKEFGKKIELLPEIRALLAKAIADNPPANTKDGGYIRDGYNAELDDYKNAGKNGRILISKLEASERTATGIKNLKIAFNRVFGYYIEITGANKSLVPLRYHRKQTMVNGERYVTEELKVLESKILGAEEKILKIELILFNDIKCKLAETIVALQQTAEALVMLDVILSFAIVSGIHNLVRPEINVKNKETKIIEGFHPVVRSLMNHDFIPNDACLDDGENRILIITGPNMAGKSTYMRQIAIITIMAHTGCFVPAKSAKIALTDRIFTRIGASDDLGLGQSTFMTEMIEVAGILNNATERSLLILDEIGRGTSTYDGLSIAWSILEYLAAHTKAKTLFSTHYHEIAELEGALKGVKNYKVLVKEVGHSIEFLYKIARGGANKSFGVKVAALAGLPKGIIDRAESIMKKLEESDINRDSNALMLGATAAESKQMSFIEEFNDNEKIKTELYNILRDTNPETCTPLQALTILAGLKEMVK